MFVIQHKTLFLSFSVLLILGSFLAILFMGVRPSIDFTGGTLIEVEAAGYAVDEFTSIVEEVIDAPASIRASDDSLIIRVRTLTPEELSAVETALEERLPGTSVARTSSIGPALGDELFQKAIIALSLVSLGIIIFVAIAFWRVSKPLSSWVYGVVTLGTLIHDVIIPAGVFALLGFFLNVEVDALFVVALLTVLGYSVNDTIVVMDRVRENLRINQDKNIHEDFERTVGKSIAQTYARSINTSLTTILVLLALFFFGGSQTEDFALALLIGVAAGAYSSIFFAAPLLVMIEKWGRKKKA